MKIRIIYKIEKQIKFKQKLHLIWISNLLNLNKSFMYSNQIN